MIITIEVAILYDFYIDTTSELVKLYIFVTGSQLEGNVCRMFSWKRYSQNNDMEMA